MPISTELIPFWLVTVAYVYITVGIVSALYIVYDVRKKGHSQKMRIMDIVWPITAFYLGPLGLWAYWHIGHLNIEKSSKQETQKKSDRYEEKEQGQNQRDQDQRTKTSRRLLFPCLPVQFSEKKIHGSTKADHFITTHANQVKEGKEQGQKPFWESVFVSCTHCGSGCALGDVLSEWGVFLFGITIAGMALWPEYIFDFAMAYGLGIIFQYFAIVQMRNISFKAAIRDAIKADTLSLVAFEIGMFGWMAFVVFILFDKPLHPTHPVYWFMMQIGMILGFFTAYPANWWLVKKGIKHGM